MGPYADPSESSDLPDVFTFLEKEGQCHSGAEDGDAEVTTQGGPVPTAPNSELPMPNTPHYSDLEVHANEAHEQDLWQHSTQHEASFNSDSAISMGSSSPDVKLHRPRRRQSSFHTGIWRDDVVRDPFREPYGFECSTGPPSLPKFTSPTRSWTSTTANIIDTPEAYYTSIPHMIPEKAQYPNTFSSAASQTVQERVHQDQELPIKQERSGYDLLASTIDSNSDDFLRPIYRKFKTLNNRMLLFLQDEISEIEDRLRELDKQENQYSGDRPASRRAEARLPSRIQWHRMDLMNRSFAKVEQYSEHERILGTMFKANVR